MQERNKQSKRSIVYQGRRDVSFRHSDEKYKLILKCLNRKILVWDAGGFITFISEPMLRFLGYSKEDLVGKHVTTILSNSVFEICDQHSRRNVDAGEQRIDCECLLRDGSTFNCIWEFFPIRDKQRDYCGVIGLVYDDNGPNQVEKIIRAEGPRVQSYVDLAGTMFVSIDSEQRITGVNRKACEILGYEENELVGENWCDLCIPEENRKSIKDVFGRIMVGDAESTEHYESPIMKKSGQERIIAWSSTPSMDISGKIIGILSSGTDITEIIKYREELKASEERFKLAQRAAHIGNWDWDILSGDLYWSDQIEMMFGFGSGEFEGTYEAFLNCIHPEDRQKVIDSVNACIDEGKEYAIEHRIVWPNNAVRWVYEVGDVIRSADGEATRMIGIVMDITERKESEHSIRKALDDTCRHDSETTALLKAVRAVLEFKSFNEAAESIFESCKQLIGAKGGYIALLDKKSNENDLVFLDAGGIDCSVDPSLPMPVRGLRGIVYTSGDTLYDNAFADSKWTKLLPKGHPIIHNVMFSPLIISGEAVGLLGLANKEGGFNDNDVKLAKAFGELAAIALWHSRILNSLQDSERKYRSVTESATDSIITIDAAGNMIYCNSATERLFGYSRNKHKARPVTEIMPEKFRKQHLDGLKKLITTGNSKILGNKVETLGLRKDGSEFPIELSLSSWKLDGEQYFTAIIRDISGRKQAETKLRNAYNTLEERVKERTAELADINRQLTKEISDRKMIEKKLRLSTEQLQVERKALERKNIALQEILDQIENEKINIRKQLTANITYSVIPTLHRLKEHSDPEKIKLFEMLESELMDITKPFTIRLMDAGDKLTPRELAVCELIKNGLNSKEIARTFNISEETVRKQRQRIRKKLGISNQNINLSTFLASLDLPDDKK